MHRPDLPEFTGEEVTQKLIALDQRKPFFVQVGAMDGVSFDTIHPFIRHFQWSGLLIEPMPDQFKALQQNYLGHPGAQFANVAIADYEGTITMRYLDPAYVADGRLPAEVLGMSTTSVDPNHFVPAHVRDDLKPALMAATRTIDVPCKPLQQVLDEHNVQKIDLFVCDVEGADWLVLQQLDLQRYQPQVVFFEFDVMKADELQACIKHFESAGYTLKIERPPGQNMFVFKSQSGPRLFM